MAGRRARRPGAVCLVVVASRRGEVARWPCAQPWITCCYNPSRQASAQVSRHQWRPCYTAARRRFSSRFRVSTASCFC